MVASCAEARIVTHSAEARPARMSWYNMSNGRRKQKLVFLGQSLLLTQCSPNCTFRASGTAGAWETLMTTDQATLVLASLLRAPRGFKSTDLSRTASQKLAAIQQLLETYRKETKSSQHADALAQLDQAYRLLEVEPPSGDTSALASRKHPFLVAFDKPNPAAETDAWRALLVQLARL
jgi:hypothetical protein